MNRNTKLTLISILTVFSILFTSIPANAAGGTNGNLDVGVSSLADGATLAIRCYNLDVSSDYGLVVNDVVYTNFTTSSTQTTRVFYTLAEEYGSTHLMEIVLTDSAATDIDTLEIGIYDPTDLVPQALLIAIIVVAIIIYFLINMLKGMKQ